MEGAGVLHATFQQESPTPAIVIKGISDAADKNKAQLDTQGYWRRLAAENSARMVLGIIRRGRIRPTGADQFKLDPTLGATADARSEIPGPAAPRGVAFLAFPRLVVPRGPLIRLTAKVEALQKDGRKLDVLKLVVKYSDKTGILRKLEQHVGTIELNGLSAAAPVSVYLMLRGVPDSVKFAFSTPTSQRTAYWRANEQGRK